MQNFVILIGLFKPKCHPKMIQNTMHVLKDI